MEVQRDIVQQLLSRLSKSERTIVTLHYLQEMTYEEIGCLLDVPANTIKSHLYRARQRLKQYAPTIYDASNGSALTYIQPPTQAAVPAYATLANNKNQ